MNVEFKGNVSDPKHLYDLLPGDCFIVPITDPESADLLMDNGINDKTILIKSCAEASDQVTVMVAKTGKLVSLSTAIPVKPVQAKLEVSF